LALRVISCGAVVISNACCLVPERFMRQEPLGPAGGLLNEPLAYADDWPHIHSSSGMPRVATRRRND
jgi:hypothetical protein